MSSVTNHSRYLSSHLDPSKPGQTYPVMRKRALGATGLSVGEIGLGTAALGSEKLPDHEAVYAISGAVDMQSALIDVAPSYGRALWRVGQAIRGRRQSAQVCLKVGYSAQGAQDFGPRALRRDAEAALKELGSDHVDLLLLHNPPAGLAAADPAWAELAKLKREGKARVVGVSLTSADEFKAAIDAGSAQVVQLPFNVFSQDNARHFEAASKQGLGLLVNRPLDSGWLAGRYGAHSLFLDERRRWSRADKARREALQGAFEGIACSPRLRPAQAALQFVLSFAELSCAVVGASAWQQVIGNVSAGYGSLDPGIAARLKDLWDKQLKNAPVGL
jgi:aryl-alcohol dehydrogenase-like predicted oxidoreductase